MVAKRAREPAIQFPSFLSTPNSAIKDIYTELNWREHRRLINPKALVDHPEAVLRNRYQDVLPWAHNRIHLRGLPYSYTNASPVSVGNADYKEKFIACQGPVDSSHMWRMTWEQDVSVIVMLTLPFENRADKCLQYYPEDEADIIDEGGFRVTLVEKTQNSSSDVRTLQISHGGEQRTISHFLFKVWPDHGIPLGSDLATLFSIMERSRAKNTSGQARIVHCSAGVGRTGTFIVLEYLMREMDRGAFDTKCDTDAVFETVDCIREQRMHMVNEQQLKLIYQILRERWQEREAKWVSDAERPQKRLREMPISDTLESVVYIENQEGN
jgi:protein-tyrosine phosphatase